MGAQVTIIYNKFGDYTFKIIVTSLRGLSYSSAMNNHLGNLAVKYTHLQSNKSLINFMSTRVQKWQQLYMGKWIISYNYMELNRLWNIY